MLSSNAIYSLPKVTEKGIKPIFYDLQHFPKLKVLEQILIRRQTIGNDIAPDKWAPFLTLSLPNLKKVDGSFGINLRGW